MNKNNGHESSKNPFVDIHIKLQKIQQNRDASDLRLRDAKNHVEQMEKMLRLLEEVQVTKRSGGQRLLKTQKEALILKKKSKSIERLLDESHRPALCLTNCTNGKTNDERGLLAQTSEREFEKKLDKQHNRSHQMVSNNQQNELQEQNNTLREQPRMRCGQQEEKNSHAYSDQSTQERKKQEPLEEGKMEKMLKQQESQVMSQQLTSLIESPRPRTSSYNLHQENFIVYDQLNHLKLEIAHLKAEVDHNKRSLAALEQEQYKLEAAEAEHVRRVHDEILAKHMSLILTKEHKELQLLYSCKIKKTEGVVRQLQSHLKQIQKEMDQVKCRLRTLEQRENHGFQLVRRLQKEITTKRRQIDSLQCKIQRLEGSKQKLNQQARPSSKLGSFYEEQHRVFSRKHQPNTAMAASSVCRRRSALSRVQCTAYKSHLESNKPQHMLICKEPLTSTPAATMSPELLDRRSPVHILLTSKPNG